MKQAQKTKEDEVKKLYDAFQSYAKVGRIVGLTKQRVHQIVKEYHNSGRVGRERIYNKALKEKCEICFAQAEVLHHKDFDNKNDTVENLQSLCAICHKKLHSVHLKNISAKRCVNCKRVFGKDIKSYFIKKGLCDTCDLIKKGKGNGRNILYPEKCIDCDTPLLKGKKNNERCRKCFSKFEYRTSPKRRQYLKTLRAKQYQDPKVKEAIKERNRLYYLKKKKRLIS